MTAYVPLSYWDLLLSAVFILVNVVIFGLIARFGDLPRLLGAWSARDE